MPALQLLSPSSSFVTSDFFSLRFRCDRHITKITMTLRIATVNTQDLPHTFSVLRKILPSILKSECFNHKNLPFAQEVRETEIGHLFEHILLEYLCILKISSGLSCATYEGQTNWNWELEPKGTFHIYINTGYKDEDIFSLALEKSISLINLILSPRIVH